ncbi:helix-turn-helix domain-containing protein [Halorubellus sp. PRR65]|uniref:helix-turn-helix domain-containing protein n=1 Tax=Halorubellus sp. PRR65 TaxID=3098148 RepID=UPI002B2612DD|nr:helix-turn-helix domain-containing protein [Halorubellus sp. PRR65]
MGVICEFELHSAALPLCSVAATVDTILTVDNTVLGTDGEPALVFSTTGVDPDDVEAALREADSVVDFVAIESALVESRYRVVLDTAYVGTYGELVDRQTYPSGALVTEHGWQVSAQFADRSALEAFSDTCRDSGIDFQPRRLIEAEGGPESYGLTEPQREALRVAYRTGYFEVPRKTDLAALAEELDTTTSALSERLRRGHEQLVAETVASPQ